MKNAFDSMKIELMKNGEKYLETVKNCWWYRVLSKYMKSKNSSDEKFYNPEGVQ